MKYSLDDLVKVIELTIEFCQKAREDTDSITDDIKKIINDSEQEDNVIEHMLMFEGVGYMNSRKDIIQNTINIISDEIDTRNLSSRFIDSMKITIETLEMIKQIIEKEDK